MANPYNVRLPEGALKVEDNGKHLGYVWRGAAPVYLVDDSIAHLAVKRDRWGSMTVDGIVVSRNSRTYREASRTLKAGIARKVEGTRVSRAKRKVS